MKTIRQFSANPAIQYAYGPSTIFGRDLYRVTEAFRYYVGTREDNTWVYVHAGYLTDGASVPKFVWSLLPPWGSYGPAVIIHDILCEYLTVTKNGLPCKISRKEADAILAEAMQVLEVPKLKQVLINAGVSSYRILGRVNGPNLDIYKAEAERQWQLEQLAKER